MGNLICGTGKSIINGIYDLLFAKTDKDDNKIFPTSQIKNPFCFKYDGSEIFWCEWWTLYLYGNENGKICGMINYIFIKGLNGIGRCIIYPAILNDNERKNGWNIYYLTSFKSDNDTISISSNNIIKVSNDEYIFNGETEDKDIKWNLTINKKYETLCVAQKIKLGINTSINLPNIENATFASIIPFGYVSGNIIIDGVTYAINQYGEMDHIWGPVLLPTVNWNLIFGGDDDGNLLYCLHTPSISTLEEKGCIFLNLNNKKYLIRDYDLTEFINSNDYPDKIIITAIYQDIIIEYNILSKSASEPGSASENHIKINIKCGSEKYVLFGMAEYYRKSYRIFNEENNTDKLIHQLIN